MKTKVRKSKPRLDYVGSVNTMNGKQDCDYYVFVSVTKDLQHACVMGYIPTDLFFKEAKALKKGDADGNNNFQAKSDVYNIKYNELFCINDFVGG